MAARPSGLALVRGERQERVATLGFFVSRNLDHAFAGGGDSALAWGKRATRRRAIAAAFTDVGLLLGLSAGVLASQRQSGNARTVGAIGGAFFVIGAPLQFSADNALSRAVWWHNLRFSRP